MVYTRYVMVYIILYGILCTMFRCYIPYVMYDAIYHDCMVYYNIIYHCFNDIYHNIWHPVIHTVQVADLESSLKSKLRPPNAYRRAKGFEYLSAVPREELHQFLIGLEGDYIIPSTVYEYEKVLRHPSLVTSKQGAKVTTYVISNAMLASVWARLRDRLASVESSTSMVQITPEYASHFYDMYINKHEGKHLTGDRIRILLLSLPFVLRDLIAPEVSNTYIMICIMEHNMIYTILHSVLCLIYTILCIT